MSTYKSRADIDGGSAINSNSAGGSLGMNGCSDTCFRSSCCCFCCADDRTVFSCCTGAPPALGSCPAYKTVYSIPYLNIYTSNWYFF